MGRLITIIGSTGFVGSALVSEFDSTDHVIKLQAPRLSSTATTPAQIIDEARTAYLPILKAIPSDTTHLINAAGLATPGASISAALTGANALLPTAIALAAHELGISRYVHISSAAVQGRSPVLSSKPVWGPLTPYGHSKALGEQAMLQLASPIITIHRPTSVHGLSRPTTASLVRICQSPLAVVAAPGTAPTPQVLVTQVAHSVRHLIDAASAPSITLQPNGGMTTKTLVEILRSGSRVRLIPQMAARVLSKSAYAAAALMRNDGLKSNARRAELLMFGQSQESGWLDDVCDNSGKIDPGWHELIRSSLVSKGDAE